MILLVVMSAEGSFHECCKKQHPYDKIMALEGEKHAAACLPVSAVQQLAHEAHALALDVGCKATHITSPLTFALQEHLICGTAQRICLKMGMPPTKY